jgi:hypothetical protein
MDRKHQLDNVLQERRREVYAVQVDSGAARSLTG